jgi:carbamoyl-phosphate synthase large subunit
MNIIYEESTLEYNLSAAVLVSPLHPIVVMKFIENIQEIDINAVTHEGKLLIYAISEYVENAGVHSGDATLVLPPFSLTDHNMDHLKIIAQKVAHAFKISGPFNMQIIWNEVPDKDEAQLKVIECNLWASRSFPFVSKVLGQNFIKTAMAVIIRQNVLKSVDLIAQTRDYMAVKVTQFSWTQLAGADPFLGCGSFVLLSGKLYDFLVYISEMASTGEVASFGVNIQEAYWASLLSQTGFKVPHVGSGVLLGRDITWPEMKTVAKGLSDLGFRIYCSSLIVEEFLKTNVPHLVDGSGFKTLTEPLLI